MYALTNHVYIGDLQNPIYEFENDKIVLNSAKGVFSVDVIGNELSIDTFNITVRWTEDDMFDGFITSEDEDFVCANDEEFLVLPREGAPTELRSFLRDLPYGTPVWWYVGGAFHCKGYLKSADRVSKNGFKITCVSGVGLLDTDMHVGGLYRATPITTVLASIIGNAFSYTVSQAVQDTALVYGHLKYKTRRNNLHELLFSSGAALLKGDADTDYIIDYLPDDVTDVPTSRVALQGAVDYQLPSNRAEITEHAFFYLSSAPTETLFDNSADAQVNGLTVIFENPVYVASLATTGTLTISEAGVNYAIVTGIGTLTGKYYVHTTQIDVLENNPNNEPIRVRRVTENELITALNARNVQRRVLSYFQSAKTVKGKILLDGERCGQLLRLTDAFGDLTQAYLSRMDTLVTSVIGATCQLIEGFVPERGGNNFLHSQAVTQNGTFTVPLDIPVDENGKGLLRMVLIQGGTGGQGGYDGQNGYGESSMETEIVVKPGTGGYYDTYVIKGYANQDQPAALGGAPGAPGQQGKVFVVDLLVDPGTVITNTIGVGGNGGARNGGSGAAGTHTTAVVPGIGSYSSANGVVGNGWVEVFSGNVYALPSENGSPGGTGGLVDTIDLYGWRGGNGLRGGAVGDYPPGLGGIGGTFNVLPHIRGGFPSCASGGGSGGAANGANGGNGGNSSYVAGHWKSEGEYARWISGTWQTGKGGDGANAVAPAQTPFGCGGHGGHGGGGGGNAGGGEHYDDSEVSIHENYVYGAVGTGGQGSTGGKGGNGLCYYYW